MSNNVTTVPPSDDHATVTHPRLSAPGGRAAAIAGALLLADAAVETIRAGSPVRWWAAGAAVAYLAVVAATWRSAIGWRRQLGIGGLALLALLAVTAWRPEGLTDGVRLLRQPTAVLLSTATLITLLVAMLVILQATTFPLVARLAAAAVAVYGVAAFAFAAWQATPYLLLFNGASLWQAAPRWLQGAIAGGVVALPIGLLVSLAGGLQKGTRGWRPQQIAALGLALVMVASAFAGAGGGLPVPASTSVSQTAGAAVPQETSAAMANPLPAVPLPPLTDAAAQNRYARRLTDVASLARAAATRAPRDHDDPAAILATTGNNPASILQWVKNETRLLAYTGTLRGASGVLMDRSGNSLDRALLVADLLRRSGNTVRIARTTLTSQAAAQLRAGSLAAVPKPASASRPDRASLLQSIGDTGRINPGALDRAVSATIQDDERFEKTVHDLYDRVLPAVTQAVGDDPSRDRAIGAEEESALRDHFWVQRQTPTGWEDLDPDSSIVGNLAQSTTFGADSVPPDLRHLVTVRVIVETLQAGTLSETSLLERTWMPAELADATLTFAQRVFPEPAVDQLLNDKDPQAAYLAALSRAWVVEPVLSVGGREITDRLFTMTGDARPADPQTLRELGIGTGGVPSGFGSGIGQLFGGAPASPAGPPDEAASPKRISAEWIEFEIKTPGASPERHRRAIFDLVGAAARTAGQPTPPKIDDAVKTQRALALTRSADIFVFGATPAPAWVRRVACEGLATAAEQIANVVRSLSSPIQASITPPPNRLALPLWSWALSRSTGGNLPHAAPIAPNVAVLWQTPDVGSDRVKTVFDVVANAAAPDASFVHRVAQGVLDTVVEHAIFDDTRDGSNTAALHALDLASHRSWLRLDPNDPVAADRLALSPEAKAGIKKDLAQGKIVIARSGQNLGPGQASWWRVDARSGETLGVGETGMGQEFEERAALHQTILVGICNFFFLGEVIGAGKISAKGVVMHAFCVTGSVLGPVGAGLKGAITEGVAEIVVHLFLGVEWDD